MFMCRIDVPVLNDQFDASLVALRRKFCWGYTDIFYKTQNRSKKKKSRVDLSDEATKRLLSSELNLGDLLLYESVNSTWWQQKEVNSEDFWEEVNDD